MIDLILQGKLIFEKHEWFVIQESYFSPSWNALCIKFDHSNLKADTSRRLSVLPDLPRKAARRIRCHPRRAAGEL